MSIYEHLEKVKLRFIAVCEKLVANKAITEEEFDKVLILLDDMDNLDDEELMDKLRELTNGVIDFVD